MQPISKAAVLSIVEALRRAELQAISAEQAPNPNPDAPSGCGRCGNPSVFQPDDDAPLIYVCDDCGSVSEDGGRHWSPSIFDEALRSISPD